MPGLFTPGGLISAAGPLRGTYFRQITNGQAAVRQLEFGPTDSQWMVGGDYLVTSEGYTGSNSLVPTEKRASGFGRLSYEIAPAFTVYAQAAYSRSPAKAFTSKPRAPTSSSVRTTPSSLPPSRRRSISTS